MLENAAKFLKADVTINKSNYVFAQMMYICTISMK